MHTLVVAAAIVAAQSVAGGGSDVLSLSQAIRIALQNNFSLLGQADAVAGARFSESASRAQFKPQLTPRIEGRSDDRFFALQASQRLPWTGGTLSATTGVHSTDREDRFFPFTTDLRLTWTQPLLRGFGKTAATFELRNAERGLEAQERGYELARQQLAVQVTRAFYNVARQRHLLEIARQSEERNDQLKRASEARLGVGLSSRLDVLRADLQARRAAAAAIDAASGLQTGLESFRALLALSPDAAVEPEQVSLHTTLPPPVGPIEQLVATALDRRLDLRETRARVSDAERTLKVTSGRLLPQIDVNVGYTAIGYGDTLGQTFDDVDHRVNVFFTAAYPLQRSTAQASYASAQLQLRAQRRSVREGELAVTTEVRAAARNLNRLREGIRLQQQTVALSQQQHQLALLRYERGIASNFDVLDAEGSLNQSRTSLIALLTDYQVALVELRRSTGALDVVTDFIQ